MADWNAGIYARVSGPQFEWGKRVLERLPLAGGETVVDAGCGAGRLTELLLERLPRGRVVALDVSETMLVEARARLARFGERVTFVRADLATHVVRPPVDAVFSTATFHWVLDHDALFARLRETLRSGGLLVAQWGGGPNLGRLRGRTASLRASEEYARFFAGFHEPWHYATPEETKARLDRAGFVDAKAWLEPAPARFDDAASFTEFLTHVILRDELPRLPDDGARRRYVEALVEQASHDDPPFELDYVRLNADARRG
ncbi:MAG TPA: methyltransferase domain-containing protein [Polyangiaceae bacterium]